MDRVAAWLVSESARIAVYATLLVTIGVMAVSGRVIRRRLRTGVLFAALSGLVDLIVPRLTFLGAARTDLAAVGGAFGALAVARLAFVLVVDIGIERAATRPMNALVRGVAQAGVYLFVVLVALHAADLKPGAVLATGTVMTAVLGLSLQETLGNLAAGVSIQLERPLAVGDWVRLDKSDIVGRVVEMNWRAVTILTDDRAYFVVPNGALAKTPFTNHSRPAGPTRRSLQFVVPFDVPPSRVIALLLAACADVEVVLAEPPPSAFTWTFTERGATYWLRFWIADYAQRDPAQAEVAARVWYHFRREKVPFAVSVAHAYLHTSDERSRAEHEAEIVRDRRAALDGVDFLKDLSPAAKETLAQRGHRKLFARGETILRQGDAGRTFYVVRYGRVAVRIDGRELRQLGPGEFFGELALLTGRERHASVVATEETEVFEIDEPMFREVIRAEPEVAERISEIVGERQAQIHAAQAGGDRPSVHEVGSAKREILDTIKRLFALD